MDYIAKSEDIVWVTYSWILNAHTKIYTLSFVTEIVDVSISGRISLFAFVGFALLFIICS